MIKAFTGLTGSGKTLSMVMASCRHYKDVKRPIYSNFKMGVFDYQGEGLFARQKLNDDGSPVIVPAIVLKSDDFVDMLMKTKTGLFLVDEAGFVFNNRKWRTLPFELVARFQQSRKLGVDIYYTSQQINRVDMTLRELTHVQIMCEMDTLPFAQSHWRLRNDAYFNPIIGHDSKSNRELYQAYREWWFWFQFKKYYPLYDTLEIVNFSAGSEAKKDDVKVNPDNLIVDIPPILKKDRIQPWEIGIEAVEHKGHKIYLPPI